MFLCTSIGTWVDTYRTGALGDYPVDNTAITTTSTTVYQNISNGALTGSPVRPLGWNTNILSLDISGAQEMTDADIDATIIAKTAAYIVNGGVGSYVLQPSAPATGTWTSKGTLTNQLNSEGTTNVTTLWQKTNDTVLDNSYVVRPVKFDDGVREMTDAEIKTLTFRLRNYIVNQGVGKYALSINSPSSGGTWVTAGSGFIDTRYSVRPDTYTRIRNQSFTGGFATTYTGSYTGQFTGNFASDFTATYTGSYVGGYTQDYTANYVLFTGYAGFFTGVYAGTYNFL